MVAILESGRNNIVVLGAGFGGITALLRLYRGLQRYGLIGRYQIVLVNRNAQHLYTPALYEIASIPRGEADAVCLKTTICIQIEDVISRFPEIRFIGEEIASLDPRTQRVVFASGNEIHFGYAVIALGSETNFFGIPGLAEHAYPLKTFADAVRLRNRVEDLARKTGGTLRVVIGGGGATGVELAAEFVQFVGYLKRRAAGACECHITIVEASPRILPGFGHDIVRQAERRLRQLGVRLLTGAAIKHVSDDTVALTDGRILPAHLIVWSGGVAPARALKQFNLDLGPKGGIAVNEFLEARPRIYAVGDCASFIHPEDGLPLPWNVPIAEAEGRIAARNIVAEITHRPRRAFHPLRRYPFILAIGGKYALIDLLVIKFFGSLGWFAKQLVELRYLLFVLPWPKAAAMWFRTVYYSTTND